MTNTNSTSEITDPQKTPGVLLTFYTSFFLICIPLTYFIGSFVESYFETSMYYGAFKGPWGISGGNVYAYYMFLIVGLLSLLGSFSVSWILAKKEGVKRMKLFYVLVTSFSISYVGCMTYYISVANNSELYAIPFILFLLFFIGGGILYLIGKSLITHNTTSSKK